MMRQYELVERVKRYNPSADEALLNRAYVYAMMAHGNQKRASGDLFFAHPLEVAAILTDLKLDEATIAAAVLHDTVEDTEATLEEINKTFGPQIGSLVDGLTKLKRLDLVSKRAAQGENFRKLLLAIADDVRVLLVKLADRLHNMRTLAVHAAGQAQAHRRGDARHLCAARRPHGHPGDARGAGGPLLPAPQPGGLRDDHPPPARPHVRRARSSSTRSSATSWPSSTRRGSNAKVKGRQKRPYSIWRKMERKSVAFEQLSDIFGFRVIVDTRRRLLPGARRRPHHLADGARPLQGLHLDPEAERLPLDPHHRDRARAASASSCRSAPPDGRGRRVRHRGARPLQGRASTTIRGSPTRAAPTNGCAARSTSSPRATTRRSSWSTPSSSCSTTRSSASPRRAASSRCPRGATPIDFAYAVHTDVGNTAVGCKINGRMAPLLTELAERRRGRDRPRRRADAAGGLGIARRHRQGAGRDPPRHPRRRAPAICRARPPDPGARLRAGRQGLLRREAEGRPAPPRPRLDRGRARGGRARRDVLGRRRAGRLSRLQGRAARTASRRPAIALPADGAAKAKGPNGPNGAHRAIPIRGLNARPRRCVSRRTAAPCRATASSASSRRARA